MQNGSIQQTWKWTTGRKQCSLTKQARIKKMMLSKKNASLRNVATIAGVTHETVRNIMVKSSFKPYQSSKDD